MPSARKDVLKSVLFEQPFEARWMAPFSPPCTLFASLKASLPSLPSYPSSSRLRFGSEIIDIVEILPQECCIIETIAGD